MRVFYPYGDKEPLIKKGNMPKETPKVVEVPAEVIHPDVVWRKQLLERKVHLTQQIDYLTEEINMQQARLDSYKDERGKLTTERTRIEWHEAAPANSGGLLQTITH